MFNFLRHLIALLRIVLGRTIQYTCAIHQENFMAKLALRRQNHWLAKRVPFYYGWIILPVSILAAVFTSPGQTFMVSVFNPSFRDSLDLSLTQLTGAYMFGTILASLPQSYIGVWMDRIGIRRMLFLVVSCFSLACVFITRVNSLPMLFVSFFFLRVFGQGALELLSVNMLPMWFDKTLGRISGIRNVVINVLIGGVPLGVLALINKVGWRSTYMLAGATVFAVMLPIAIFLYINRPEEIGQAIDQEPGQPDQEDIQEKPPDQENEFTLKMAMGTRAYWLLTGTWFAWAGIATAITFNLLPIFTAKGFTEEQAAGIFTILMAVSAVSQIIGGVLADRVDLRWLASGSVGLYAAAVGALLLVPNQALIPVYTVLLGLGQGLFGGLGNTAWVRYFGRKHLGKIRGSVWTAGVAGSSVGPFLMGLTYDYYGSFQVSLIAMGVILLGLAITNMWATQPVIENGG